MRLRQRISLMIRGRATRQVEAIEDPEVTLSQVVIEMGHQLASAKRAAAQAAANERRLRARLENVATEATRFTDNARTVLARGDEALAREALVAAEHAERLRSEISDQLAGQEADTTRIRELVARLHRRLDTANNRLALLRSRSRQTAARQAIGQVLDQAADADLYGEFERLGERIELRAEEEAAFLEIEDEMSGAGLRQRLSESEIESAVDSRLDALRCELNEQPAS